MLTKTEKFINQCKSVHNNKYDYSKTIYVNSKTKIKIICPEHGEFECRADMHLFGTGCKECGKPTLTKTEFIKRATKVHGNKYDYSKVVYINSRLKIKIICPEHGEFEQIPANHLNGLGCAECSGNKKLTLEEFKNKANQKHNNKYNYDKVEFTNTKDKILIFCNSLNSDNVIHGYFEQRLDAHLFGQGCPKCKPNYQITNDEFINRATKIHGDKYSYHKTEYINMDIPVWIHCEQTDTEGYSHGDFLQIPYNHLEGKGCPKCAIQNIKSNTDDFINKSKLIHINIDGTPKYDYSQTVYSHSKEKLIIICPKHGEFEQIPNGHLNGNGCMKCSPSFSNVEIDLRKIFENFEIQTNVKTIINGELDIFIPEKNIAIEYNGLYWHSEVNRPDNKYHLKKTESCESKGIQLIHVFEDEWVSKQDIVKSRIKNILGITDYRIYARKCSIREVETSEARKFLEDNHIQGFVGGKYYYGLYYQNKLVSIMTFGYLRRNLGQKTTQDNEYELLRFCNMLNTSVIGAASKLFKHFLKIHNPKRIISYADRRWSIGKLYETLGFKFSHNSSPNYFYVIGRERKNRYNFRKDILIKEYGCSVADTEHNFCFNKGWYRIYDSGAKVYEFVDNKKTI
jgi:hypothetical protein